MRVFRHTPFTAVFAGAALMLACMQPASVCAQGARPNPLRNLSPENLQKVTAALAQKLNLDPGGVEVRRVMGLAPPAKSVWVVNMPLVKHFRGKNGIPIPSREELGLRMDKSKIEPQLQHLIEADQEKLEKWHKSILPPLRCTENKTTKEKTGPSKAAVKIPKDKADEIVLDMLFISKDDVPENLNTSEAFGTKTYVRVVDLSRPEAPLALKSAGVTCLPYRYRVSRSVKMRDEGLNAILNYNDKTTGKGKLSKGLEFLRSKYE